MEEDNFKDVVLKKCTEGTIVAFKDAERNIWYTGVVKFIFPPNSKNNNSIEWSVRIDANIIIEPQFYTDRDKYIYYVNDFTDLIILENGRN